MELAKFFQVDWLREKCQRQLKMCREMPYDELVDLAKEHNLKALQVKTAFKYIFISPF